MTAGTKPEPPDPNHAVVNDVVVVGGGISGLACAYHLQQMGRSVTLFESSAQAGGLLRTAMQDGFLFETGPQSFQGTETILALVRDLGIEGELYRADSKAPRYVLRHGKLVEVPLTPQALLSSSLLGMKSRLKLASEVFTRSRPPTEEESVADFVRRKFGHEILEYLVTPFVSGVYAGDPERLSLSAAFPTLEEWERQYGSVLRGAMKSRSSARGSSGPPPLCSFRRGIHTLAEAMAKNLGAHGHMGARVTTIEPATSQAPDEAASQGVSAKYRVRVERSGVAENLLTRAVVLAIPAYAAAHLVEPISATLAKTLSGVVYAPVVAVTMGYYAKQFSQLPQGFGVLIPRSEKQRTLGIVWNSSLFPDRAPEGQVNITSFLGGATDTEIMEKSDKELSDIVTAEAGKILGITGPPILTGIWRHPKALPQYNLGHHHVVRAIREGEQSTPGLFFAGNYLEGPAIGKCIELAYRMAESAHRHLG
jgi:oxygen-dependent protoporphyrinogen oxidase